MRMLKFTVLFCLAVSLAVVSGCGKAGDVEVAEDVDMREPAPADIPVITERADISRESEDPAITRPVIKEIPPITDRPAVSGTEGDGILVADFEGWPNNLGGEPGVYGSLEPDWDAAASVPYSWVYGPDVAGYDPVNVHGGAQSFRLVNGLGLKPGIDWGSFSMDLGPTVDATAMPKKVESLDASEYRYLTFWVKGERGGEKMQLLLRDANSINYMPQVTYDLPPASNEWTRISVPLAELGGRVDITALDNLGIAFGPNIGNMKGETVYLDDFLFTNGN